ncbi:hypothetical protein [Thiomicrospira sp. WB1]|uniref:LPS-assembly lipoprotein LptE n=1 Tax=Thiomicrospira sp. WB1 TaxID=1685380 RepID=UPI00074912E7|nr:hypothetical protein [Thiomicrospira sp. WB1]KUJ72656.1 hypothetical protein AVO41_02310 [Thiomicrospira sp. WB1]
MVRSKNDQAWWVLSRFAPLLLAVLLLTGCGFQLKGVGSATVTFQSAYVQADGARADVTRALNNMLEASSVQRVNRLADAEVAIRLGPTQYKTTRTSISGSGDTGSELITMTQPFSADQVMTAQALVQGEAISYRDRRIETGGLAAAAQELESLRTQMANELAMQILDRVQRAYEAQRPKPLPSETLAPIGDAAKKGGTTP